MNGAMRVFIKECLDALRDRRTIVMLLTLSVVMGPLVLFGMSKWIQGIEAKAEKREVSVAGMERAPTLANFLARQDIAIKPAPADYEQLVRSGKLDVAVIVGEQFENKLTRGEPADVTLMFDSSRPAAQALVSAARGYLRAFSSEQATLRLLERGVSPDVNRAIEIENDDVASERKRGAAILLILQITALMACVTGSLAIATDVTAGERERGSLEPLLMNPISPIALTAGKWLAVTMYGLVITVVTLLGYVIAIRYLPAVLSFLRFGEGELLRMLPAVIPFVCMVAAVEMLIAISAKNYKEAQTYLSYFSVVISLAPTLAFFLEWQDQPWLKFAPVVGQNAVLGKVLSAESLGLMDYLVPGAIAIAIAAACLFLTARLLTKEKIIFGR